MEELNIPGITIDKIDSSSFRVSLSLTELGYSSAYSPTNIDDYMRLSFFPPLLHLNLTLPDSNAPPVVHLVNCDVPLPSNLTWNGSLFNYGKLLLNVSLFDPIPIKEVLNRKYNDFSVSLIKNCILNWKVDFKFNCTANFYFQDPFFNIPPLIQFKSSINHPRVDKNGYFLLKSSIPTFSFIDYVQYVYDSIASKELENSKFKPCLKLNNELIALIISHNLFPENNVYLSKLLPRLFTFSVVSINFQKLVKSKLVIDNSKKNSINLTVFNPFILGLLSNSKFSLAFNCSYNLLLNKNYPELKTFIPNVTFSDCPVHLGRISPCNYLSITHGSILLDFYGLFDLSFDCLRHLNLANLSIRVLKFSKGLINLESLCIDSCNSLTTLELNIKFRKLLKFSVSSCKFLLSISDPYSLLPNIRELYYSDCQFLNHFASFGSITNSKYKIESIDAKKSHCSFDFESKHFIVKFLVFRNQLSHINLNNYSQFFGLTRFSITSLQSCPENISQLKLIGLKKLHDLSFVTSLKYLQSLTIENCRELTILDLTNLEFLTDFELIKCKKVQIRGLTTCFNLLNLSVVESIFRPNILHFINQTLCFLSIKSVPMINSWACNHGFPNFKLLKYLVLENWDLDSLDCFGSLTHVSELYLSSFPNMSCLQLKNFPNLNVLNLDSLALNEINAFNTSLSQLNITRCSVKSWDWLLGIKSLISFTISECDSLLDTDCFCYLFKLNELNISDCPLLVSLNGLKCLSNLTELVLKNVGITSSQVSEFQTIKTNTNVHYIPNK
ncbi:hypothetical protein P9112_007498 [Eukaryota sp. TZLM1-RC]